MLCILYCNIEYRLLQYFERYQGYVRLPVLAYLELELELELFYFY